jgi:hypothetical protein
MLRTKLAKQFIMHAASAQDAWQSGIDCFSWGQQSMSPIDDMSVIAAIESALAIAGPDGITIGAVERPTIARTESRRKTSDQSFNRSAFRSFPLCKHIAQRKKRPSFSSPHESGCSPISAPARLTRRRHARISSRIVSIASVGDWPTDVNLGDHFCCGPQDTK